MKKEQLIKFLVPLVAVLVIAESVVLVIGARKQGGLTPAVVEPREMKMALSSSKEEVGVGEKTEVGLKLTANKSYALDSLEAYIKYDPTVFEVSGLTFDESLPKPTVAKISRQKGLVIVTYFIDEPAGYRLEAGQELKLVSFKAAAKKGGTGDFQIATGEGGSGSASMLVESGTSKVIPLETEDLTIWVKE